MKIFNFTMSALLLISITVYGQTIQQYSESKSNFSKASKLIIDSNKYPPTSIYRIYKKAGSGFSSINSLRDTVMQRIYEFSRNQDKESVILGEQTSNPPYIFGNFPRIEIVFALIEKSSPDIIRMDNEFSQQNSTNAKSKEEKLLELKTFYEKQLITREEYELQKKKVLDE